MASTAVSIRNGFQLPSSQPVPHTHGISSTAPAAAHAARRPDATPATTIAVDAMRVWSTVVATPRDPADCPNAR